MRLIRNLSLTIAFFFLLMQNGKAATPFQPSIPQTLPYKSAAEACFDLILTNGVKITNIVLLLPYGKLERSITNQNTKIAEFYKFSFPINHYSWTEFAIRFTPLNDGEITLKLNGPYEFSPQGKPFREDNLWDEIEITGSEIKNSGFENVDGNRPTDWVCEGGVANSGPMPAKEGRYYARTSFDRSLKTEFKVKANSTVSLKLSARSQPPPSYSDMRRILSTNTPAHLATRGFLRGVNLGKYLELNPANKGLSPYIHTDFQLIKSEGFDHVRIPIAWHFNTSNAPKYEIDHEFILKVEYIITNSFLNGLNVILAWSNFEDFNKNPLNQTNLFYEVWKQISRIYALYPSNLAFELIDSPPESITSATLNTIYFNTLSIIRKENPERTIFLGPTDYSIDHLRELNLPFDDDAIIICIHIAEPEPFTQQGLISSGTDYKNLKDIIFPGPPPKKLLYNGKDKQLTEWIENYNNLPADLNPCNNRNNLMKLETAKQWSEFYGRPVYLCGFGASYLADNKSRALYYSQIRRAAENHKIGWSINDWKLDYKYIDPARNQPVEGLHDALFKK